MCAESCNLHANDWWDVLLPPNQKRYILLFLPEILTLHWILYLLRLVSRMNRTTLSRHFHWLSVKTLPRLDPGPACVEKVVEHSDRVSASFTQIVHAVSLWNRHCSFAVTAILAGFIENVSTARKNQEHNTDLNWNWAKNPPDNKENLLKCRCMFFLTWAKCTVIQSSAQATFGWTRLWAPKILSLRNNNPNHIWFSISSA